MEIPKYLQVLWGGKWLLLVGLVVAAIAAFFAGFTLQNGEVVPRAEQQYTASTTIMVDSQTQPLYQAVIPGQEIKEGVTAPEDVDLTSKAIIYAYLISGLEMRSTVEKTTGTFADTDGLTALRRTTQPGGNEAFPGRYSLPIIDVIGTSLDPDRAQEISRTAAEAFEKQVVADQDASKMPASERVTLAVLDEGKAVAVEGSNPAIPVVVAFLGVFLLFVAAVFVITGATSSRRRKREAAAASAEASAEAASAEAESVDEPAEASTTRSRRRAASVPGDEEEHASSDVDEDVREPVPTA